MVESSGEPLRRTAERAVRRLGLLSALLFALAGGVAVGGGALVAWLARRSLGTSFGRTWLLSTLVVAGAAGAVIAVQERRRGARTASGESPPGEMRDERTGREHG